MLIVGFFFLLRPGEYAATANENATPFRVCDVHILLHTRRLDPFTCPEYELHAATHVALEFTSQKNGVRGELVGLTRSSHPVLCPILALCQRLRHLRLHRAPLTTPLYCYCTNDSWHQINTSLLTVGISPLDISVRSLRSSGATALLCADVDTDKIRLLGRWRSDEKLRYLHVQALPIVTPFASLMVRHGYFSFIPNNRMG
jgi:hypothetical protein